MVLTLGHPALAMSPSKTSDFCPGRSSVVLSRPLIGRHHRIEASSSDVVEVAKKEENKGRTEKLRLRHNINILRSVIPLNHGPR
jgi:hypothetical protein